MRRTPAAPAPPGGSAAARAAPRRGERDQRDEEQPTARLGSAAGARGSNATAARAVAAASARRFGPTHGAGVATPAHTTSRQLGSSPRETGRARQVALLVCGARAPVVTVAGDASSICSGARRRPRPAGLRRRLLVVLGARGPGVHDAADAAGRRGAAPRGGVRPAGADAVRLPLPLQRLPRRRPDHGDRQARGHPHGGDAAEHADRQARPRAGGRQRRLLARADHPHPPPGRDRHGPAHAGHPRRLGHHRLADHPARTPTPASSSPTSPSSTRSSPATTTPTAPSSSARWSASPTPPATSSPSATWSTRTARPLAAHARCSRRSATAPPSCDPSVALRAAPLRRHLRQAGEGRHRQGRPPARLGLLDREPREQHPLAPPHARRRARQGRDDGPRYTLFPPAPAGTTPDPVDRRATTSRSARTRRDARRSPVRDRLRQLLAGQPEPAHLAPPLRADDGAALHSTTPNPGGALNFGADGMPAQNGTAAVRVRGAHPHRRRRRKRRRRRSRTATACSATRPRGTTATSPRSTTRATTSSVARRPRRHVATTTTNTVDQRARRRHRRASRPSSGGSTRASSTSCSRCA